MEKIYAIKILWNRVFCMFLATNHLLTNVVRIIESKIMENEMNGTSQREFRVIEDLCTRGMEFSRCSSWAIVDKTKCLSLRHNHAKLDGSDVLNFFKSSVWAGSN